MNAPAVSIIDTGVANLSSVEAAFRRLGITTLRSADPSAIADAPLAVLPGVGAFGAGMSALRSRGLERTIVDRVAAQRPLLAICLGLQMLCESSEESPGVPGLGVLSTAVTRLASGHGSEPLRVPHLGWNLVTAPGGMVRSGHAYFAHTFRLAAPEQVAAQGWVVSTTDYGGPFAAAIERGPVVACQFHPELSSAWGLGLIARWLHAAGVPTTCASGALAC